MNTFVRGDLEIIGESLREALNGHGELVNLSVSFVRRVCARFPRNLLPCRSLRRSSGDVRQCHKADIVSTTKTTLARPETVERRWFVVDADGEIVGRLATKLAMVLMGKHKPSYTPHLDCGDYVVVLNAHRVRFSGKSLAHPDHPYFTSKMLTRTYDRYSGYPSGRRVETAADVLERHPERILREAVRRMLPKSKLGRKMLTKLKLYAGEEHPHQAQQPQPIPEYLLS
jgi:large subunit ribosomal protein L13